MKHTDPTISVPTIKIKGRELTIAEQDQLASVFVERSAAACDRFELRFDVSRLDPPSVLIGDPIRIGVAGPASSEVTILDAEVTGKATELSYGIQTITVSGLDKRHRLTRTVQTRAFNDASFRDVVSKIAGEHELTLNDKTGGALAATIHPHLMQAGSDFELVQQITYRIGAEWFVDDAKLTIQLRPTSGAGVELTPTENLVSFNVRFSPVERSNGVTVQGWDAAKTEAITGQSNSESPTHDFPVAKSEGQKLPAGGAVDWVPVQSAKEADGVAAAMSRRLVESAVVGHGETSGTPDLVPGSRCTISDVGDEFSGTYHVASVEHTFGANGSYRTRFRIGPLEPSSLIDMLSPSDAALGQVFNGVTVGIVTNIEPDDRRPGVVKVNLSYLGEKVESTWARVMSFGGGDGRGAAFGPEVGDEVVVAFEHGDVARPYVLGSVWNAKQSQDLFEGTIAEGKVRERRITSKLGSRVRFIDAESGDDESGIAIEMDPDAGPGTRLFFGYKKTELVTNKRPLELKNGKASILLDDDEITITAKKITLKANGGDVDVSGTNVSIDANSKVALSGAQAELMAQAQAKLQASGIMTIKGSMVKVN